MEDQELERVAMGLGDLIHSGKQCLALQPWVFKLC